MTAHGPNLVVRRIRDWLAARHGGDQTDAELLGRFAARHDEAAFADLVHRHGGMVLGVCRRVLGDADDAEDAFQATFLVLARKADSIRRGASLPSWLHGVARRVALEARKRAARRRCRERGAATAEDVLDPQHAEGKELRAVLDEELGRLPEKYRAPLVLHYLEGHTKEETARRLGWTEGTVSGRLARARDLLGSRLSRRGLVVSGGALAAALAAEATAACVSETLAGATVRLAGVFLAGPVVVSARCARIGALTDGVVRAMLMSRLKLVAAAAFLVLAAGLGMAGLLYQAQAGLPGDVPGPPRVVTALPGVPAPPRKPDQPLLRVALPGRTMLTVALSAHGRHLAVAPQDRTIIQLWDVATGKERTLAGHAFSITALAFSPDGKTLASATGSWLPDGAPGEIKLWDVAAGTERATLGRLPVMVLALAFSPDGKTLASVSQSVKLWDVTTGKETADLPLQHADSVAFSPDGKTLAVGQGVHEDITPGSVVLWDLAAGKERASLEGHVGMVGCLAFTPDGTTLASADSRGTIKLWDVVAAEERRTIRNPGDSFFLVTLAITSDGRALLAIPRGMDGTYLKQWDLASGTEQGMYFRTGPESTPPPVSGDGEVVGLIKGAFIDPQLTMEVWERRGLALKKAPG